MYVGEPLKLINKQQFQIVYAVIPILERFARVPQVGLAPHEPESPTCCKFSFGGIFDSYAKPKWMRTETVLRYLFFD